MESMAGEGQRGVGGCSEKPLNNRASVITIRSTNVDDISDVLTKENGTHSVIVKNDYSILSTRRKFYHPDQGVKDINDQGHFVDEFKRTPVLYEGNISKAKLAILKLFDDFDPDLHRPNGRNDSHQDEVFSFQPSVTFRTAPYFCGRGAETHSSSTSSSAGAFFTSSSAGAFSTSYSAGAFSTSSSSLNPSIYPVNLMPRMFKKESLAMKNEQFDQPSQDHSEPFSLSDTHVRERPVPVGLGISWNDYPFQSEKTERNDLNNNINHRGFKLARNNSNRFLNSSFYEKASADNGTACGFAGCGKIFSKRVHLNAHIRVHNGEKPFRCSWLDCGKAFTRQGELKRHEWVHTKPERFYCDNCGKKFSRADHLKMHKSKCKSLA